jgi:hypothetical protein
MESTVPPRPCFAQSAAIMQVTLVGGAGFEPYVEVRLG